MNPVESEDFPKRNRIRNANLFKNLINTGRRSRLKYANIITAGNNLGYPRLGISIAKKAVPRAVDRNRLKRIYREIFRKNKKLLGTRDLLIICSQNINAKSDPYMAADIRHYFTELNEY